MGILKNAIGSLTGGLLGTDAASDAAKQSARGYEQGIAEQRRQFDTTLNLQAPTINTGNAARSMLASILGLNVAGSTYSPNTQATAAPVARKPSSPFDFNAIWDARRGDRRDTMPVTSGATPGLTFTNPEAKAINPADLQARLEAMPGYQFAVNQATRSAEALGSATGSLGGNVLSALGERVGGGIAMPVFQDYLNRLSGLSGGGSAASSDASGAAIRTGENVASGLSGAADARASGIIGRGQNIGNAISSIGGLLAGFGGGGVPKNAGSVGGGGYRYGP